MQEFQIRLELAKSGFTPDNMTNSIPGWPYEIGDEICIPSDLAAKWGLSQERSEEFAAITAFYANSSKAMIFVQAGLDGDQFWELYDVQWTPREALRKALAWIDQVPPDASSSVSAELDRDVMEQLLRGESHSMSISTAISVVLDWVSELDQASLKLLPDFPHRQVEDGRDHPLALFPAPECAQESCCDFEP